MILGYEEPVLMPTMDIYSTDLMKMYIAAVKDLYDTAKKDYLDFLKQYQDFYSNMPGANEFWYANTIGKAQQLFDQAAARGVDLFKTKEGQGAIQSLIRNAPIADLAKVKKYSENYDMYLKNKAAMDLAGKYSDAREQYELARLGLSDYTLLDEHGNIRPWERLSPIQNRSMSDIIDPIYKKFAPLETLRNGDRPFTIIKGVKPQNQQAALSASVLAMKSSGDYDFYKQLAMDRIQAAAERQGLQLSPQQLDLAADAQLQQDIQNTAAEYLQEKEEYDKLAFDYWAKQQDIRQHELNRANERNIAALKNPQPVLPLGLYDTIRVGIADLIYAKTGSRLNDKQSAVKEFYNFYKNKKGFEGTKFLNDLKEAYTYTGKDKEEKIDKFLKERGYIDEKGKFTDKYSKLYALATNKNHNLGWSDYVKNDPSPEVRASLLDAIADPSNKIGSNDPNASRYEVRRSGHLMTLADRQNQVNGKTRSGIGKAFVNWLNAHVNVKGYLNGTASIDTSGQMPTQYGTNTIDINSFTEYRVSDILKFLDASGISEQEFLKATGASVVNNKGESIRYVDDHGKIQNTEADDFKGNTFITKKVEESEQYYVIPMANIVDLNSTSLSMFDTHGDKTMVNETFAKDNYTQRQYNAINNQRR